MAKENEKNLNQENQNEPEKIDEEGMSMIIAQEPWWKKVLKGSKYVLAAVLGFVGKAVFDRIRGGNDEEDSGDNASESND